MRECVNIAAFLLAQMAITGVGSLALHVSHLDAAQNHRLRRRLPSISTTNLPSLRATFKLLQLRHLLPQLTQPTILSSPTPPILSSPCTSTEIFCGSRFVNTASVI